MKILPKMKKKGFINLAALFLLVHFLICNAWATTYTFIGGGGNSNWDNVSNWTGGIPPNPLPAGDEIILTVYCELTSDKEINGILTVNVELWTSGGVTLFNNGTVNINGELIKNNGFINTGIIAPGINAPGKLVIKGETSEFDLGSGSYHCQIFGNTVETEYDLIETEQTVILDQANLVIDWGGFIPVPGSSFTIIRAGMILDNGPFKTVTIPPLSGLTFEVEYAGTEVVVHVIGTNITNNITLAALSNPYCAENQIVVNFAATGTFNLGNTFTAQLSDASGSFVTPVATASGISPILLTIPVGVQGSGYKVRVIGSDPAIISNEESILISTKPTVNVTGNNPVCVGGMTNLSPISGGVWISNELTKATVTNAGLVTGLSPGTVTFTFTETTTGCSNTTAAVTINPLPLAPSSGGLIPTNRCPVLEPVDLTSNVTCGSGQVVIWYDVETGGNALSGLPAQTPLKTTNYYAACRNLSTGCESLARYKVTFTANPVGSKPINVFVEADGTKVMEGQAVTICDLPGNALLFSSSCGAGEIQLLSVDGLDFKAITPAQVVDGLVHNYKIRCQAGTGVNACLGPESGIMSLRIYAPPTKPAVSISPMLVCEGTPAQSLISTSSCGTATTIWFDAITNNALASLPTVTPAVTTSYYAKCQGEGNCLSEASNVVTVSVVLSATPPMIMNNRPDEVCVGTEVTLTTNCPIGSTVVWNNVYSNPELVLSWLTPHIETISAKCVFGGGCETPNANKRLIWKILDVTIINIGASESATKPGANVPMEAWSSQFVMADGGPTLEESTQANPTLFYTENVNKGAPRYWTVHVDACKQPLGGSVSYDLLCKPEFGPEVSFNTHENIPPYMMFANRDNFTELYAMNNPFFGFYLKDDSGKNVYDAGFPKGLYKMGIRYWEQKGIGVAPAVRKAVGDVLLYKEYWFRIVSKFGINTGAAREGITAIVENEFASVVPNPVTHTLTVSIKGSKSQEVMLSLVDIVGRTLLSKTIKPGTNDHREEIDMTRQSNGIYFLRVNSGAKSTALKIQKVAQH